MCFDIDYDWYAEVVDSNIVASATATTCNECHRLIAASEQRRTIHQQQYELCRFCEDANSEDGTTGVTCPNDQHDFGETFDYVRCMKCEAILDAIERIEKAEGCKGWESRPSLCGLSEEVSNGNGWPHYVSEAKKLGLHEAAALMVEVYGPFEEDC